ncbi:MAG: autotransporter domain-containing protein [Chthoniobacteraceae bacterium]
MIRSKLKYLLALGVFALAMRGTANAQWTTGGASPLGGTIFVGSGNTGPLSTATSPALTLGGGDTITLNLGGFAMGSGVDTIIISGPNNLLTNFGTIQGDSSSGYNAIDFNNSSQTIVNYGNIIGGAGHPDTGSGASSGGHGIYGDTIGDLNGITITNHSGIFGGNGGAGTGNGGGDGGYAIYMETGGGITGFTLTNTGGIYGGNGGNDPTNNGGGGADAIYLYGDNALFNTHITNSGVIQGGQGGSSDFASGEAASGGDALDLESGENVSGLTLINSGSILGGKGGDNAGTSTSSEGGEGGYGLYVFANTFINNVQLTNSGVIAGGAGGNAAAGGSYGQGGYGIYVQADGGSLTDFTLNNTGKILGGAGSNGGYYTSPGGPGLYLSADTSMSNVTLNNSGMIAGGNASIGSSEGYYEPGGGYGIDVEASGGSLSGFTLNNSGSILGGSGGTGGEYVAPGGYGLYLYSDTSMSNVTLNNSGTIAGGAGGSNTNYVGTSYGYYGGGYGIYVDADGGNLSSFTLNNSGSILGGNGGAFGNGTGYYSTYGTSGGTALRLYADNNLNNIVINNSGSIIGGNGGISSSYADSSGYGNGGYGIDAEADGGDVNGFTLNNSGFIKGGNGDTTNYIGDSGGNGVYLYSNNNITNVLLNNSGSIIGGNSGEVNGIYAYYVDGDAGYGVYLDADDGNLTNVTLNNSGLIAGGNGGNVNQTASYTEAYGGDGAIGIYLYANSTMSNVLLKNSGSILGGNGGSVTGVYAPYVYEGGDGATALYIEADTITGLTINNSSTGVIAGGNGGNANIYGGNGGDGIDIYGGSADSGNILTNYGVIRGGNGGAGATVGDAGYGIYAETNGLTINNWGSISAGSGASRVGVEFDGSNNTLNLNGHSSVNGPIEATGNSNNVVSLNFTGLSPQAQAALIAQVTSQGNLQNFTGTFTVRGVTYTIDPAVIRFNLSSYQQQAATPNEFAIGANLDSLTFNPTPGSSFANLLNAIDQSGAVAQALNELSPQSLQIYGDIATATANSLTLTIDERLNNLRDGSESIDTTGIGGGSDVTTTAGYDKDGKTVVVPDQKSLEKRWGFFAEGGGLFANIDAHDGLANQGFTTSGLVAGVDGKVNDHLVLGGLFNYEYTTADLDNIGSKANVQTIGGGIYAGYHNEGWYGNGLATYGHNDYDSHRNILLPGFGSVASGDTHGSQESVNIDGGYDYHLLNNKLSVGPLAGLQYVHLDVDGFNEAGAAFGNLSVGSQDVDSLRSRLGFHADYRTQISKEVAFATEIHAAWQHEFLDDSRAINSSFIGSGLGAFSVQTTNPQRDAVLAGVGVNITIRDTMTLFFDYDVQAGQQSYLEQSVKGGIKLSF